MQKKIKTFCYIQCLLLLLFNYNLLAKINIGFLGDFSTENSLNCHEIYDGLNYALTNINKLSDTENQKYNLIKYDTAGKPKNTEKGALALSKNDTGLLVSWGAGPSYFLRRFAETHKITVLSTHFLENTIKPFNPYTFIPGSTYTQQIKALLKFTTKNRKVLGRPVTISLVSSEVAESMLPIQQALSSYTEQKDIKILENIKLSTNKNVFINELTKTNQQNPDYILIHLAPDDTAAALNILNKLKTKASILVSFLGVNKEIINFGKFFPEGLFVASPFSLWEDKISQGIWELKQNNTQTRSPLFIQGYVMGQVIHQASQNTSEYKGADYKRELEATNFKMQELTADYEFSIKNHEPSDSVKLYRLFNNEYYLENSWLKSEL